MEKKRDAKDAVRQVRALADRLQWIAVGAVGGVIDEDDLLGDVTGCPVNFGQYLGAIELNLLPKRSPPDRIYPWEFEDLDDFEKAAEFLYDKGVRVKLDE